MKTCAAKKNGTESNFLLDRRIIVVLCKSHVKKCTTCAVETHG